MRRTALCQPPRVPVVHRAQKHPGGRSLGEPAPFWFSSLPESPRELIIGARHTAPPSSANNLHTHAAAFCFFNYQLSLTNFPLGPSQWWDRGRFTPAAGHLHGAFLGDAGGSESFFGLFCPILTHLWLDPTGHLCFWSWLRVGLHWF